tara:strand:- start:184 stop:354 length:171 start_codon:yes stop_codon:yes gene_type:complete
MKTYAIRKVKGGFKVVWFWDSNRYGDYPEYENNVEGGFYKKLEDAENHANNLAYTV